MTKSSNSADERRRSRPMDRPLTVTSEDVSHVVGEPTGFITEPVSELRGTKASLVRELLRRPQGVQLGDLCEATGWLPQTCRAHLTGLRKKGMGIVRESLGRGRSVYRLVQPREKHDGSRPSSQSR